MRRKFMFLFILSAMIVNNAYSETITADSDEVVIDLNDNTLTSDHGVAVTNGNMKGLFYKFRRNPETGEISFEDNAIMNIAQPSGNIKIETEGGKISQANEEGEFYNSFAYVNVAKMTGAEAPNDKIYFGSPLIKYSDEKINAKDAWVTTDFNIVNFQKEPEKAGYHIFSSDVLIEPDKQITLKKSDLFIKGKDVMPFHFPWFRANIRSGSTVPLFVTIQSSDDYGAATSMGFLYGNRKDKFRGGFAPKFADKMGILVGRWENWYKFDKIGETRLNIDDWLIYAKNKEKPTASNELPEYEKRRKRYKVELSHDYEGENGNFHFLSVNSTRSMVGSLADVMEKFDDNNVYNSLGLDRYKFDKNIGFYTLDSNLYNLGEKKDISFSGKMSLVSDKKAYGLLVYDSIDDISYGSTIDHDLYTNLSLTKDNDKYKFNVRYDYLYDMDPGSTASDLMARNERIGADLLLKENGASISYDKRKGDDYRRFSFWEEDINTSAKKRNILGIDFSYTPTTVAKYDYNNFENIKLSLGNYKMGRYTFTPTFAYNFLDRKLDEARDTYRKIVLGDNRLAEFNRFENTIYENTLERRADLNLYNDNEIYRVGFGKNNSEIWSRDGLFDGTYRSYENKSSFYELELGRKNIELADKGTLGLDATFRHDEFDASSDKTNLLNLKLDNDLFLYKGTGLDVTNKFRIEGQKYSFSGNKNNEERRLINKSDFVKFDDTLIFDGKSTVTTYNIGYKTSKNPYGTKSKNGEELHTGLNIKFDEDTNLDFKYSDDKRYTTKTRSEKKVNDLSTRQYSVKFETKKYDLGFSNTDIDFVGDDFYTTNNFREDINEHRITGGYKFDNSRLAFTYAQGRDKLKVDSGGYLNRKNRMYSATYNIYGDVEQDFTAAYKTYRYGNTRIEDDIRNTDTYSFAYAYRDKRFEKEELMKYATLEYEKPENEITANDIDQIRAILDRKSDFYNQFELTRIKDETFRIGNYKKAFNFYVNIERNNKRYSQTGNLRNSMSKFTGGLTYTYNRVGIGYKFTEKASWKSSAGNYYWGKDSKEHEFSLFAKIGKPSQGWKVKTYAMFYENKNDTTGTRYRKKSLDSLGIEIGKEMGFYEWAVSYENRYKASSKDYEWRVGVHFTLLTFPNNSLLGVGAKNTGGNTSTRPDGYLLDRPSQLKNSY
ncbi:MAG: hypothetical protein E7E25_00320 [Fusobacterium periodonticum]|nr:hypothetical protein [Fusobacterium periodonticum]